MVELMLTLFVADPLVKLFPDTLPRVDAETKLTLRCARNEYEPAQFGIRCNVPLEGLTVRVSPLVHEDGTCSLAPENIRWNFVGFIPLEKNTPGTPAAALVREAPCEMPDVLLAERTLDLPADRTQPVWLTVFVPEETPAGLYRGKVTVSVGRLSQSLPLELTVWPFTVPEELAAEIVAAEQEPLLLVWTKPLAETEIVPGPIVVEVWGATEPGTTVQINGTEVAVDSRGHFAREIGLSSTQSEATVTVTATRNGSAHTVTRRFVVRAVTE